MYYLIGIHTHHLCQKDYRNSICDHYLLSKLIYSPHIAPQHLLMVYTQANNYSPMPG